MSKNEVDHLAGEPLEKEDLNRIKTEIWSYSAPASQLAWNYTIHRVSFDEAGEVVAVYIGNEYKTSHFVGKMRIIQGENPRISKPRTFVSCDAACPVAEKVEP